MQDAKQRVLEGAMKAATNPGGTTTPRTMLVDLALLPEPSQRFIPPTKKPQRDAAAS